jgi:hypothetical protein
MTPIVDEIGQKYGRQLDVVYAEVDQRQGQDLAKRHGIIGYPTILLLDSEGERAGLPHWKRWLMICSKTSSD